MFWAIGGIIAAGLAWAIVPSPLSLGSIGFGQVFHSWRLYLALCVIFPIIAALSLLSIYESPISFYVRNRAGSSLEVLLDIYQINTNAKLNPDQRATLKKKLIRILRGKVTAAATNLAPTDQVDTKDRMEEYQPLVGLEAPVPIYQSTPGLGETFAHISMAFSSPYTTSAFSLLGIWVCFCFAYYGLSMWMPDFFSKLQPPVSIYADSFAVSVASLPGSLIALPLISRYTAKVILPIALLISALAVFILFGAKSAAAAVICAIIFSMVATIAWNSLTVVTSAFFPLEVRSTAYGTVTAAGRLAAFIGNAVFGALLDKRPGVPLGITAVGLTLAGLAALLMWRDSKASRHKKDDDL